MCAKLDFSESTLANIISDTIVTQNNLSLPGSRHKFEFYINEICMNLLRKLVINISLLLIPLYK